VECFKNFGGANAPNAPPGCAPGKDMWFSCTYVGWCEAKWAYKLTASWYHHQTLWNKRYPEVLNITCYEEFYPKLVFPTRVFWNPKHGFFSYFLLFETRFFFNYQTLFVTKLRNRLNGENVLWLLCVSIINIIEKLCLIINSLINCAWTNSSNFTMTLSFHRSKSHSFQNPKKTGFPGFLYTATRSPGFKIMPGIRNTTRSPRMVLVKLSSSVY